MTATLQSESVSSTVNSGFVGRARELAAFGTVFDTMLEGWRQILMLAGEPGIGKTRLAEELAEIAEDRGALVLWGRCYEEPGAPPYWPWVQILREYIAASSPSEIRRFVGTGANQIAALVPEYTESLGAENSEIEVPFEPGSARFLTFDAICQFLRRATAQVPLVMIMDDVHWGDKASLALLEFLSRELTHSRLLIVCTYRDTEISRTNPLLSTLGELSRSSGIERLKLGGLDTRDVASLARHLLGTNLSAEVMHAIDQQTDGNPLFVIELLKVLIEESREACIEPIAVRIPDGVRETIGRRLSHLPEAVNESLRIASVLGRRFDCRELAGILGADVEPVLRDLQLAERTGFVAAYDDSRQRFRFAHALIRETLYDEIPTTERLRLHGKAGDALAALETESGQERLSRIAHHYFESAALGFAEKAADYANRAGHMAIRMDAYEDAMTQFGNEIELLRQYSLGDDGRMQRAMFFQSRAMLGTGDANGSALLLVDSLNQMNRVEDDEWFVNVVALCIIYRACGNLGAPLPPLKPVLDRLPPGDSAARAKALAAEALAARIRGEYVGIREQVMESVEMARRLGDSLVQANCLRSAFYALRADPSHLDLRLLLGREFVRVAPLGNASEHQGEACSELCISLVEAGRIDELERLLDEYQNLKASRLGLHEYRLEGQRILLALMRGEYQGLVERIEKLRDVGRRMRGEEADGPYSMQMFVLQRDQGNLNALAPMIERFATASVNRAWAPGLMLALIEVGKLDLARPAFEKLAADDFGAIPEDDMRVTALVFCAETCSALKDRERASQLYALLLPYAGMFASQPIAVCFGAVDLFLGMLAVTAEDHATARVHLEAALQQNAAARAWPWVARCSYQFALLLKTSEQAEDRLRAKQLLRDAEQIAGSIGMKSLAEDVSELLRGQRASDVYPDALTAREVDVLRLLAIGRSNKDIALVLSISLNTVATHVRNILTKTGCANRTEAAAYAARNKLVET